ncbi:MAG: hypothetical protein J6V51_01340, partial [Bacteroidales bacterium]|nr:hypothetical protein [Bacteroidales bacterium]
IKSSKPPEPEEKSNTPQPTIPHSLTTLAERKIGIMPRISKKCSTFALLSPSPIRKDKQGGCKTYWKKQSIRYYFAYSQESLNSEIIRNRD